MSESAIRTQIASVLSGISNIGKVYSFPRSVSSDASFLSLFKASVSSVNQIRLWIVSRERSEEKQRIIGQGTLSSTEVIHHFQINGWMSLKDSSSTSSEFEALVELIRSTFRSNRILTNTCVPHHGVQVQTVTQDYLNKRFCHKVTLTLDIIEYV